jgi:hypothetical protein
LSLGGLLIGTAFAVVDAPRTLLIVVGLGVPRAPRTPAGADRWLDDPRTADAGLTRASALLTAGRPAEARAILDAHPIASLEDEARVARMRAAIDGLETGTLDPTAARAAIDRLGGADRRYHELSFAWSIAWVAVQYGRAVACRRPRSRWGTGRGWPSRSSSCRSSG